LTTGSPPSRSSTISVWSRSITAACAGADSDVGGIATVSLPGAPSARSDC
jgi:hypothetical protein